MNYVVLFNERQTSGLSYSSQIRTILDGVIDTEIGRVPEPEPIPAMPVSGLLLLQALLAIVGSRAVLRRRASLLGP